jgi:hypothetical protein
VTNGKCRVDTRTPAASCLNCIELHRRRRCSFQKDAVDMAQHDSPSPDVENNHIVMEMADIKSQLSNVTAFLSALLSIFQSLHWANITGIEPVAPQSG